jgi:hypothetical protein
VKGIATAVAVCLVTVGSLSIYMVERSKGQAQVVLGDTRTPDRVDIFVFVQKVDPLTQELAAQVEVIPKGALADDSGFPKQDLTLYTNGTKGDTLPFKAGNNPGVADLGVALNNGVITDYPFDSYNADLSFDVETKSGSVPISVTLASADAFFNLTNFTTHKVSAGDNSVNFSAKADRSTGTFAFSLFIMLFMWMLSIAAVIAAWFVVSGRHGLLWAPMSFMGALLFALVPLRNAVPGQPPIGSIIDFGAFFIAEGLISISLITTVIVGYRIELAKDRAKKAANDQPAPPVSSPLSVDRPTDVSQQHSPVMTSTGGRGNAT